MAQAGTLAANRFWELLTAETGLNSALRIIGQGDELVPVVPDLWATQMWGRTAAFFPIPQKSWHFRLDFPDLIRKKQSNVTPQ